MFTKALPARGSHTRGAALALTLYAAGAAWLPAAAALPPPVADALSHQLTGGSSRYCIAAGDTLLGVAARYAEPLSRLLRDNHLEARAPLVPGQCLRIDNRHVVPAPGPRDGILINVPQRMLFQWRDGALTAAYPAALGRPDWPTPLGEFHVAQLRRDPVWYVPGSIRQEQRAKGEPVLREVPSGPDNPLGHSWIGLDLRGYGIHGTNAPASIYSFRTHGCIRLHDEQATQLFGAVRAGTTVRIVYRPWLLAELPDASLWLEVDPDIYRRAAAADSLRQLRALAARHGIEGRIDWSRARQLLANPAGLAEPVGRPPSDEPAAPHTAPPA